MIFREPSGHDAYLLAPIESPSMIAPPFEGLLVILHDLYFPLAVAVWRHVVHGSGGVLNRCAAMRGEKQFRQTWRPATLDIASSAAKRLRNGVWYNERN